MENSYLEQLNAAQREAVVYVDSPLMIIAGAGSGKTRVLTYKIAHLIKLGLAPYNILALTFTNKAADEMKERIAAMVGEKTARYLYMGTFHSVFASILRREVEAIGFKSNFTIYDGSDSKSLVKKLIKELQLDDKIYNVGSIVSKISALKSRIILPEAYASDPDFRQSDGRTPYFSRIYALYQERCRAANAMDFDDILVNTFLLFKNFPEILAKYQDRFQYILIDEYQDTNIVQHLIVKQLAELNKRICVVGDDAQSIYSFRGANIDNILQFQKIYPDCKIFRLEQNYRSTQNIVNAANSLIKKNRQQISKNVFSENSVGQKIKIIDSFNDYDEANSVVAQINSLLRQGEELADFAVLYRTNSQSRVFEEALRKEGLAYKIYGGLSFYQRKEIKDVLAYCRLIANEFDEEAWRRIVNFPARGMGETTQEKILAVAHQQGLSALEVMRFPENYNVNLNAGVCKKMLNFSTLIDNLIKISREENAFTCVQEIIKQSGIRAHFNEDNSVENQSKKENIDEFLAAVHSFCEKRVSDGDDEIALGNFLSEVSLLSDQEGDDEEEGNQISLMTVHASKGLEFKNVFVTGLEELLFPSAMCQTDREIEEERRLLYVAITRAKERCALSFAKNRFRNGRTQAQNPSRFLKDIDEEFLVGGEFRQSIFEKKSSRENSADFESSFEPKFKPTFRHNLKSASEISSSKAGLGSVGLALCVGQKVHHSQFGVGEILELQGAGDDKKAKIAFKKFGEKTLLLRFAKLTIID